MDCSEFRRQNTAPVFPGKVNRWVVAAADVPGANETLIRDAVESEILNGIPHDGLVIKKATQAGQILIGAPIVKRREDLTALPILTGGPKPWSISLEFNYRGSAETIAWPIVPAPFSSCDTNQLNWTLMMVGKPLVDAPKEPTLGEVLENAGERIEQVTRGPARVLIGAAFFLGIGYLWVRKL